MQGTESINPSARRLTYVSCVPVRHFHTYVRKGGEKQIGLGPAMRRSSKVEFLSHEILMLN